MSYFANIHRLWLLWSATLVYSAHAQGWNDFSNNLATDLSPLIALFGENVTKQFLSESLSPLDNFIFAMAPLGILTAVVSAIRVSGSPSLRAFMGRAQKGDGVVEAELCSSTSRSVSELYNNGGIARVFGRPKIVEVLRDPNSAVFMTVRECIEGAGKEETGGEWKEVNKGVEGLLERLRGKKGGDEKQAAATDLPTNNPNLSLNIGKKRQSEWVFWASALTGGVLQIAVLVFGAIITYRIK
ncbi:hypothetical protein BJX66DRAFT_343201 [Aspergillus keveii]|uniref:Uncharacterized protein n=1 Tax=Aspergillus keveii TaxID=714993 RepID=A0ABR4FPY6_9EURO